MTATHLLALAIVSADPPPGLIIPYEHDVPSVVAILHPPDHDHDEPYTTSAWLDHYEVTFRGRPLRERRIEDLIGRRVRAAPAGYAGGEPVRGRLEIVGGSDPEAFRAAMEAPADPRAVDPAHRAIVGRGMGSGLYATREAASGVMARKGLAAVPALREGLTSRDAEVRVRCAWALEAIRAGD
jgi:hypothetical protein